MAWFSLRLLLICALATVTIGLATGADKPVDPTEECKEHVKGIIEQAAALMDLDQEIGFDIFPITNTQPEYFRGRRLDTLATGHFNVADGYLTGSAASAQGLFKNGQCKIVTLNVSIGTTDHP